MKGMILAAGVGSRLSPITGVLPKPMVPVADKPVMEHALELLVRAGITEIKANLHHLPHVVEQYFGNGSRWGADLSYSLERTLLGTAGAVKRVQRFFDDTFVVTVADSLWDLDVAGAVAFHRARGAMATVVVKPMPLAEVGRFGIVEVDDSGRIVRFREKPRPEEAFSNLASTGFYILEPEALDLVPPGRFFDFARDLFPLLLREGLPFCAYPYEGPWSDIGTFDEYARVHRNILRGAYTRLLLPARKQAPGTYLGHHLQIDPGALIRPPVLLGNHCRIHRGAVVGPDAVVGSHSVIGEDAHVVNSIVGDHTYVGRILELRDCLAHGHWLVRLSDGVGLYVEDPALLSDLRTQLVRPKMERALDVSLAGLALLGATPLFLGLGLAARLEGQTLVERVPHLAPDPRAASPSGVPRLRPVHLLRFSTRGAVGRLAERIGVARLPGLFNVVRGDISLVGTRPLTEEELAHVPEEWRAHLHRVPAGFTGLWRVNGGDQLSLDETLAMDAYYAASKGVREDLKILWRAATRRKEQTG